MSDCRPRISVETHNIRFTRDLHVYVVPVKSYTNEFWFINRTFVSKIVSTWSKNQLRIFGDTFLIPEIKVYLKSLYERNQFLCQN